jgi:putative FmdB family regulatory protein
MPIYEYRCTNGHTFEAFQSMSEDPIAKCAECSAKAERVLSAPAVHFKGSGFYTTDYARKGRKSDGADGGGSSSDSGSSSEKSSSSDSGSKSDSKKSSDAKTKSD